jgi:THO complex subunit 2
MSARLPSIAQIQTAFQEGGSLLQETLRQSFQALVGDNGSTSTALDVAAVSERNISQEEQSLVETIVSLALQGAGESSSWSAYSLDALLDVLWIFACAATAASDENSEVKRQLQVLSAFLQTLRRQASQLKTTNTKAADHPLLTLIQEKLVAQFPSSLLESSGWIRSTDLLEKKVKLCNTQTHYKQFKFNLLPEQTEGYSKLLLLLMGPSDIDTTQQRVQALATLVGTFSLDPIRCADLLIDVIWRNNQLSITRATADKGDLFILLNSLQLNDHLPALLAFKLSSPTLTPARRSTAARRSRLLHTMVQLVQHQQLDAQLMLQYFFSQADPAIALPTLYQTIHEHHRKRVHQLGKVKLSSSASGSTATAAEAELQQQHDALLAQLAQSPAIQFLQAFFDHGQGSLLVMSAADVLDHEEWSQLCFLLPDTIGVAIASVVQREIEPYLSATSRPPWAIAKTATSDTMDVETPTLTFGQIVDRITPQLMYMKESGCILRRPVLFAQLCRLLASRLPKDATEATIVPDTVLTLIRSFVLPSLSLFPANPSLAHEVWSVLRHLPYPIRYSFYEAWRGKGLERAGLGDAHKPLWLVESEFLAGKDVRYALKRVAKDTIREMSRQIAKVCHSHPLVVFTTILNQIESYDNLVQVMVDILRFVTPLGLDILSCCILNRLSESKAADGANRSRLKEDGLNVSQWLQSLESLVGYFYKQHPSVDFRGILCYLMKRLQDGHVMELGVLRSLLKTSAGWSFADYAPAASLSFTQLMGRSGSNALKRETMSFGIVDDINRRASIEIRRVLQTDNMGISLLILLAQVRNCIVFGQASTTDGRPKPVKLVAYLLDSCQVTMAVLLDFLSDPEYDCAEKESPARIYVKSLPALKDLFDVYGLDAATSWMFYRPLLRAVANQDEGKEGLGSMRSIQSLGYSLETYEAMLSSTARNHIRSDLFEAFCSLSLYDIYCPEDVYKAEIGRLEKEADRLAQLKPVAIVTVLPGAAPQRSEKADKERVKETALRLAKDFDMQLAHVSIVKRLIESKSKGFFNDDTVSLEAISSFLSNCIYPRCMEGPDEAMYCAHFISLLHSENTPGFGTLQLYDSIVTAMSRSLFGLTEGEAANLSILLLEVWKTISRWRYDEDAFHEEVTNKHGSFMKSDDGVVSKVSNKDFEALYNRWHAVMGSLVVGALKSSQYIHTRNCLILLTRMVNEFPTRPPLGYKLVQTLEPLSDESQNSFADIRASAAAYSQQLIRARDDGVWREESAADVTARQLKHEEAAAARQKQAEVQMEEIKQDSEKIGKQLGPDRWKGDRRRDGRPGDGRIGDGRDRRPEPNFVPPPVRLNEGERRVLAPPSRVEERKSTRDRVPPPTSDRLQARGVNARADVAHDNRAHPPPPVRSEFSTMAAAEPSRSANDRTRDLDRGRSGAGLKRSRSPEEGETSLRERDDQRGGGKRARVESSDGGRDGGGSRGGGRRRRGGRDR